MNEKQLLHLARRDEKLGACFAGVFASDELAALSLARAPRPTALICNLDPRARPGTHWIALFFGADASADYFCSYGTDPPSFVLDFVRRNTCPPLRYSTYSLQSPLSVACGAWCILFLKARARGRSLRQFTLDFTHYGWIDNHDALSRRLRGLASSSSSSSSSSSRPT